MKGIMTMFKQTIYKNKIKFIEYCQIPSHFENNARKILNILSLRGKGNRNATFCITTYPCKVKIKTIRNAEFKNEIEIAKTDSARFVMFFKTQVGITAILYDKGKEIGRETVLNSGLTNNIYKKIDSMQDSLLEENQAKEILTLIDGFFFQGISPYYRKYRVAVSGFGALQESENIKLQFDEDKPNELAKFMPFIDEGYHLSSLPTLMVTQEASSENAGQNPDSKCVPDLERINLFIRFLIEVTNAMTKNKIEYIEKLLRLNLKDYLQIISKVKNLINNVSFNELLNKFRDEKDVDITPVEFLIEVIFKYKILKSNAKGFNFYKFPTTISESERERLLLDGSQKELDVYKISNLDGNDLHPGYYEILLKIALEHDIDFNALNVLYVLLMRYSNQELARRFGHCSEDNLLRYLKSHKNEFINTNCETVIFNVLIPTLDNNNRPLQHELRLKERCKICDIHFDDDLLSALEFADNDLETFLYLPSKHCASNSHNNTLPENSDSKNWQLKYVFVPRAGFVSPLLEGMKSDPITGHFEGYDGDFDKIVNRLTSIINFSRTYANELIKAIAKGQIDKAKSILNKIINNELKININSVDKESGNTALHYAAMINTSESPEQMCELLLELLNAGGNPALKNISGETVLDIFEKYTDANQLATEIFLKVYLILKQKCPEQEETINDTKAKDAKPEAKKDRMKKQKKRNSNIKNLSPYSGIPNDNQVSTYIHETQILEAVKNESLKIALSERKIGPREIQDWELKDVPDQGNCFYDVVCHQLYINNHHYLGAIPHGTLPRDSLRLFIQGSRFEDREYAGIDEILLCVMKLNVTIAIVDTRHPYLGFRCYYQDVLGNPQETFNPAEVPSNVPILRLAYTGNHYLSVRYNPPLQNGALRRSFTEPFLLMFRDLFWATPLQRILLTNQITHSGKEGTSNNNHSLILYKPR